LKPSILKGVVDGLRKQGTLSGVSRSGVLTRLAFRGYPMSHKMRFDPGKGAINDVWVIGVRERVWGAPPGGGAPEFVEEGCD
jgi:hypothetical protein